VITPTPPLLWQLLQVADGVPLIATSPFAFRILTFAVAQLMVPALK